MATTRSNGIDLPCPRCPCAKHQKVANTPHCEPARAKLDIVTNIITHDAIVIVIIVIAIIVIIVMTIIVVVIIVIIVMTIIVVVIIVVVIIVMTIIVIALIVATNSRWTSEPTSVRSSCRAP